MSDSPPREVAPPITPAATSPGVEVREDIKEARVRSIVEARETLRDTRLKSQMKGESPDWPEYTRASANSDYLAALQEFIDELRPLYLRFGVLPEYWERDQEPVLAVLQRPAVTKEDVLEPDPKYYATGYYPPILNPGVLEPEVLGQLSCLTDLLRLDDARIPWSVELRVKERGSVRSVAVSDTVVLSRSTLDRARRWCFEFAEEIGLSLGSKDSRKRRRLGGKSRYGDD